MGYHLTIMREDCIHGSFRIHFDAAKSTMVHHRLFRVGLSSENAEFPVFHNISVDLLKSKI